tara:strand:+ start:4617 stop:4760 length:144 start_codon:yes stop_codon:yes gene_type:complete
MTIEVIQIVNKITITITQNSNVVKLQPVISRNGTGGDFDGTIDGGKP